MYYPTKAIDFDDVLIVPKDSDVLSREDVQLNRRFPFWYGLPLIAANMENIGTLDVAMRLRNFGALTALTKGAYTAPWIAYNTFETYGINDDVRVGHKLVCLDVANGYLTSFVDAVARARDNYPEIVIMAGNVVTPEGVESLVKAGANIIKVGIGSGSACLTRDKTGVGYPQLSAVLECADAAHSLGAYICSDGGHRSVGDIAKSFAAGADFVMLGGMLAGTTETGVEYYGNASKRAQGVLAEYRAEEGREITVAPKGGLDDVIRDILGGLRSTCTYVGARNLRELHEKAEFVRVK